MDRILVLLNLGSQINDGDTVALRAMEKGTYFSSNGGGNAIATADRPQRGAWETLQLTITPRMVSSEGFIFRTVTAY